MQHGQFCWYHFERGGWATYRYLVWEKYCYYNSVPNIHCVGTRPYMENFRNVEWLNRKTERIVVVALVGILLHS